jgi:hypothetical protein
LWRSSDRDCKQLGTNPFLTPFNVFVPLTRCLTFGVHSKGDGLSFITPSEQETKNVKFDGKEYPNEGPNADRGASSSIRRVDERTLVMTDKAGGKVRDTEEIDLSADLKTLTITVHITGRDKPNVMVFERK